MNPIYKSSTGNEWIYSHRGLISNEDPSKQISVTRTEIKELLNHYPQALYIRWVSDLDKTEKINDYYYVLRDKEYDISELPSRSRSQVRKCLRNCEIKKVSGVEIVNGGGYNVYLQEINRFSRRGMQSGHILTESEFTHWMKSETQDLWVAFHESRVIGYAICRPVGESLNLVTWKADYTHYSSLYPSYGMLYTMVNEYMSSGQYKYVFDGGRSMTEHSNVQEFLLTKMAFRKADARLQTYIRPWLKPALFILAPFEPLIKNVKLRSIIRLYKWSK